MSVAPLQFLLLVFAGWVNRHQIEVIVPDVKSILAMARSNWI